MLSTCRPIEVGQALSPANGELQFAAHTIPFDESHKKSNCRRLIWDSVLMPFLVQHLGASAPAEIHVISSAPAIFTQGGIAFQVVVSAPHGVPSSSLREQILDEIGAERRVIKGLIRQDLSVMVDDNPLLQ
jgi:hypothetical protein